MAGFNRIIFVHTLEYNKLNEIVIGYDGLEAVDMHHNIFVIDGIEYLSFEDAVECLCELRSAGFKPTDKYASLIDMNTIERGI